MNNVFHDYIDVFVVIYLYDVMIYSENLENYLFKVSLVSIEGTSTLCKIREV